MILMSKNIKKKLSWLWQDAAWMMDVFLKQNRKASIWYYKLLTMSNSVVSPVVVDI